MPYPKIRKIRLRNLSLYNEKPIYSDASSNNMMESVRHEFEEEGGGQEDGLERRIDQSQIQMFQQRQYISSIESINRLIELYGLRNILEIMDPLRVLFNVYRFYNPSIFDIVGYINMLKILFNRHIPVINYLFDVKETLGQMSVNGKIFIICIKGKPECELLVKVPLLQISDPISYEYYVGLALNQLRYRYKVNHFSLVYGRFNCKIDIRQKDIKMLCNGGEYKTHVLYEYIKDPSGGEVMSLKKFIITMFENAGTRREAQFDLLQILFMLMAALQNAQDNLHFTHYDLHLENILIMVLKETTPITVNYRGSMITILSRVVPYIIDYGRSHIDKNVAVSDDNSNQFVDYELNKRYNNFEEYQRDAFKNFADGIVLSKEKYIRSVDRHIKNTMERLGIPEMYASSIFKRYYGNDYSLGIKPFVFHQRYDLHRLIKTIGDMVLMISPSIELWSRKFWMTLIYDLENAYPFYVPYYNALPIDYESITGKYNKPIDLADTFFAYMNELPIYTFDGTPMQLGAGKRKKEEESEKESEKKKRKSSKSFMKKKPRKIEIKITKSMDIDNMLKEHMININKNEDDKEKVIMKLLESHILLGPIDNPYEFKWDFKNVKS